MQKLVDHVMEQKRRPKEMRFAIEEEEVTKNTSTFKRIEDEEKEKGRR
jgi:hypothetical protein